MKLIIYTKTDARQHFATLIRKAKYSGGWVGIGKTQEEVEVLVVPRPVDFRVNEEWVLVRKGELVRSPFSEGMLYHIFRGMQRRADVISTLF